MPDTFIIGSRALKLSKKRRKEMASYMRWVRSLRKYVGMPGSLQTMECRKINEREVLAEMLAQGEPKPRLWTENLPDHTPRIERTEQERYEDRIMERENHTSRALSDMARYRHEGPR